MNTEAIKSCPKCNAPIPLEAPQGLCPKCLLAAAAVPTEPGQSAEGTVLPSLETISAGFPQLEIIEFIGQGGMGMVFKARQTKLDRFVALKLLPQKPGSDPAFCERFNREARVLARLSHPNIVAVHDFGETGPFFYLVMEFVDGVNLRQAMKAGRFTPAQALALVPKICDALQYAHEEGILHRDIKPENLLLDTRGRVKIADFGIAKLLGDAKDITLTARGSALGTPHYMAPEQIERPQDVDQRADVYSLGVVFYEMLTGELPIGRFAPPSEKTPMDPRIDQVVLRTLEKERDRRFSSAGDVKTQVEKITSNPAGDQSDSTRGVSSDVGSEPQPPLLAGYGRQKTTLRQSVRRFAAFGLVGFSLMIALLAVMMGAHISPRDTVYWIMFMGIPGLLGTLLAWSRLRELAGVSGHRQGGTPTLLCAVAWPLLLLDAAFLFILLLSVEAFQWQVFHVRSGGLMGAALLVGVVGILFFDVYILRHWLGSWRSARSLPLADLRAFVTRLTRVKLWASGLALGVFVLVLFISHRQTRGIEEPTQAMPAQDPNAPPRFEVASGAPPGNEGRLYRSSVVVPPGYALTVATVLYSNQTLVRPILASGPVTMMAPEGQPVQGQLTWRLLGNSTFADGAPLQLSLGLLQGPDHTERSLHIAPPEPVTIDWVGEPAQLWPPQNGHTKYLLIKGTSASAAEQLNLPTEWAVGIELRLDPIPADLLLKLNNPAIDLVTNFPASEGLTTTSANITNVEAPSQLSFEKIEEYKTTCSLLEALTSREKHLVSQFSAEAPLMKNIREQIAAHQKTKDQMEADNPGIAVISTTQKRDEGQQN